jgi:hypothetical protein
MLAHAGRRPECASIRRAQLAQQDSRQVNRPLAGGQPLESDLASHHGLAHKTQAPLPPDLAIAAHAALLPSCRILHLRHALGPITPATLVMLRRSFLPQRLVRSFLIVNLSPTIQPPLLRPRVAGGRSRRLRLQHPVHLLVRAIVLGMCGPGKFDRNAQYRPPRTQARQSASARRGKRAAIVHADHLGQAILAEQPPKHCPHPPPLLIGQQPHRQQITAEQIAHRQGIHPLAIDRPPPAFEIHRPYLIGFLSQRQLGAHHHRPLGRTTAARPAQPQPLQPTGNRAHGRHLFSRVLAAQHRPDFFGAPTPAPPPQLSDALHPIVAQPGGRIGGTSRLITQATNTLLKKARLPFISRLAAHLKNTAQFGHRLLGAQQQFHQAATPLDQQNSFPRHPRGITPNPQKVLPMSWPHAARWRVQLTFPRRLFMPLLLNVVLN